jgi:hypothetical protein
VGSLARTRAWAAVHRAELLTTLVVLVAFAVCYLAVLRTTSLYAPDTRYYAAMALRWTGIGADAARDQVLAYTRHYGWATPPNSTLFGSGLVQPRVVYPLLSVPFVWLVGIRGMAVVPLVAMAVLVVWCLWLLRRRYGLGAALAAVLLVVTSNYLMFFGTAMLTESLTALWCVAILAAVWRYQRRADGRWLAAAAGATVLMAFTRQAALIPAGALVVAWLGALVLRDRPARWGRPALTVGATAVVVQVVQTLLFPSFSQLDHFLDKTGTTNLRDALAASPGLGGRILRADLERFAATDRPLLTLIALATVAAVVLWRHSESHLLVGAFLAITVYNVTNGTPTNFRYAMPGLVFYVVAVAALLGRAMGAASGRLGRAEDPGAHRDEVDRGDDDHRDELREVRLAPDPDEGGDDPGRQGEVHDDEHDVAPQRAAAVPDAEHDRAVP